MSLDGRSAFPAVLLLVCGVMAATAAAQEGEEAGGKNCDIHTAMYDEKKPCNGSASTNPCAAVLLGPARTSSKAEIIETQAGDLALDRNCTTW